MKMNRRELIIKGGLLFSYLQLSGCVTHLKADSPSTTKRIAFFTRSNSIEKHPQGHRVGGETALYILNVNDNSLVKYDLPMTAPHSLIQHPFKKNILIITPRDQSLALVIDTNLGTVVKKIELTQNKNFYGHGFFSPSGDSFFLTGYDINSDGFLNEYDLNWKQISHIDTFGKAPHEVKLIGKSDVLLVANNGWSGKDSYYEKSLTSMCYIDLFKKTLIEKIELPLGHLAFQHFESNTNGDFVVACDWYGPEKNSHEYKSLLAYKKVGAKLEFLEMTPLMKKKMKGNILSLRWNELTQDVITTTPEGPVTVWNLKKMAASHQVLNNTYPHGLEISSTNVWVTTSNSGLWKATLDSDLQDVDFKKIDLPEIQNITAHAQWVEIV